MASNVERPKALDAAVIFLRNKIGISEIWKLKVTKNRELSLLDLDAEGHHVTAIKTKDSTIQLDEWQVVRASAESYRATSSANATTAILTGTSLTGERESYLISQDRMVEPLLLWEKESFQEVEKLICEEGVVELRGLGDGGEGGGGDGGGGEGGCGQGGGEDQQDFKVFTSHMEIARRMPETYADFCDATIHRGIGVHRAKRSDKRPATYRVTYTYAVSVGGTKKQHNTSHGSFVDEKTANFIAHYLSTRNEECRKSSMHGRAYLNSIMPPAIKNKHKGKIISIDGDGTIRIGGEEAFKADWTGLPQYVSGTHWKKCTVPDEKMNKLVKCGVAKLREDTEFDGEEEELFLTPGAAQVAVNEYIKTPKKDIYYAPHQSMPNELGTHNKWEQVTEVPEGGHVLDNIDVDEMFLNTNCYIQTEGGFKHLQPLRPFWGIKGRVRAIKSTIEYFGAPVVIEDKKNRELARFYNPYSTDMISVDEILAFVAASPPGAATAAGTSGGLSVHELAEGLLEDSPPSSPRLAPEAATAAKGRGGKGGGTSGGRGNGGSGGRGGMVGGRGKGEGKSGGGGGGDGKGGEWAWDEWLRKQRERDAVQQIVDFLKNKEVVSVEEIAQALGVGRSR